MDSEVRPVLVVGLYWIVHQGLYKASAVSPCVSDTDMHENDNDNESSSVFDYSI